LLTGDTPVNGLLAEILVSVPATSILQRMDAALIFPVARARSMIRSTLAGTLDRRLAQFAVSFSTSAGIADHHHRNMQMAVTGAICRTVIRSAAGRGKRYANAAKALAERDALAQMCGDDTLLYPVTYVVFEVLRIYHFAYLPVILASKCQKPNDLAAFLILMLPGHGAKRHAEVSGTVRRAA
jgi:hypothetical protein